MSSDNKGQTPALPTDPQLQRRRTMTRLAASGLLIAAGAGAYWFLVGQWWAATDNAYVGGNIVQITPQVTGTVVGVLVDDTDLVAAGQPLVRLDPADTQVQLELAEANLAEAVRTVRGLYASDQESHAVIEQRSADMERARFEVDRTEAELQQAQAEYQRREALFAKKFIAKETLQSARTALDSAVAQRDSARAAIGQAEAAIRQAREQQTGTRVLVDNTSLETHPRVAAAAAQVKDAYLALARTSIVAPIGGYVAKRSVQLGERVAPGTAMLAVIPLDQLWVDANFKETELENVRIGQEVTLRSDLYGGDVSYRGQVVGLAPGTGGAFALLPAQNATGNWIKIVQRVAVRIALDPAPLAAHPLRIGLSMRVSVDTHVRDGATLATRPRSDPAYATSVFEAQAQAADSLIAHIIDANRQDDRRS